MEKVFYDPALFGRTLLTLTQVHFPGMALLGCDVVSTDQIEVVSLLRRNIERNTSRIMQMNSNSGVLSCRCFYLVYRIWAT